MAALARLGRPLAAAHMFVCRLCRHPGVAISIQCWLICLRSNASFKICIGPYTPILFDNVHGQFTRGGHMVALCYSRSTRHNHGSQASAHDRRHQWAKEVGQDAELTVQTINEDTTMPMDNVTHKKQILAVP